MFTDVKVSVVLCRKRGSNLLVESQVEFSLSKSPEKIINCCFINHSLPRD